MKQLFFLLLFSPLALVVSCSKIPPGFEANMNRFLEQAGTLSIRTDQGINYTDFNRELATLKGQWKTLSDSEWPPGMDWFREKRKLEACVNGWDWALSLWREEIEGLSAYESWSGEAYSGALNFISELGRVDDELRAVFRPNESFDGDLINNPDSVALFLSGVAILLDKSQRDIQQRLRDER